LDFEVKDNLTFNAHLSQNEKGQRKINKGQYYHMPSFS